jgi:hypothetical protein
MHLRLGRRMVGVGLCGDPKDREGRVDVPSGGVRRGTGHVDGLLHFHREAVRWARQDSRYEEESSGARMAELDRETLHGDGSDGPRGHGHERICLGHQTHDNRPTREDHPIHEGRQIREDQRNLGRQRLRSRRRRQEGVVEEHQSARNQGLAGRHQPQCDQLHPWSG